MSTSVYVIEIQEHGIDRKSRRDRYKCTCEGASAGCDIYVPYTYFAIGALLLSGGPFNTDPTSTP